MAAPYPAGYQQAGSYARPVDMAVIMRRAYLWLTLGLLLGFGVAFTTGEATVRAIAGSGTALDYTIANFTVSPIVSWGSVIVFLGVGFFFAPIMRRTNVAVGTLLYLIFTVMFGFMASSLIVVYSQQSIWSAFLVTAGMFAVLSVIGYTTRVDLSRFGMILLLALVGLIIASVVNYFAHSGLLYSIINYAGVILFSALIAFDTQRIKRMATAVSASGTDEVETRVALLGAFTLFLDFVNLFLFILRITGRRR